MFLVNLILLMVAPEISLIIIFFKAISITENDIKDLMDGAVERNLQINLSMGPIVIGIIMKTIAMLCLMHIANYFDITQFFLLQDIISVSYVYISLSLMQIVCMNNQLVNYNLNK